MKSIQKFTVCTLLLATVMFLSCRKDSLCETCGTNQSPVAKAGDDQHIILPLDSTTINASASSDPDGIVASFAWKKIAGPASISILKPDSSKNLGEKSGEGSLSL